VLLVLFDRYQALQTLGNVRVGDVRWPTVTGDLETGEAFASAARIEIVEYPSAPRDLVWEQPDLLRWGYEGNVEPAFYCIYGGDESGFPQDAAHLIGTTSEMEFEVPLEKSRRFYVVTATDEIGHEGNPSLEVGPGATSGVPENQAAPLVFSLSEPSPNPAVGEVRMRIGVPSASDLVVALFDARGRRVRSLFEGTASPGWCDIAWDGRDRFGRRAAEGVYFVRMQAGEFQATNRIVLMR
jgi:hypothetical protein